MQAVKGTRELRRIRALPRRDWRGPDLDKLVPLLTQHLRRPGGSMELFPVQAAALADLYDYGGLFAPIQVGGGKSLISLLAPVVLGAKRPVLLVPASLREKTHDDYRTYGKHWRMHPALSVQSYETLSRHNGQAWLDKVRPDLIIGDEAHRLKNTRAAVTRKVGRYLMASRKTDEPCKLALMSGTMTSRALREYWHLIRWCLGPRLAPVPNSWPDMAEWGLALDSKVEEWQRMHPGALVTLGQHDPAASVLEQGRQAYSDRLYHTPGVIVVKDQRPPMSLEIRTECVSPPEALDEHFRTLRNEWETPDGHPFETPIQLWGHARELAMGMYYVWDPRPPMDWLWARKAWSKFVRDVLSASNTMDSPMQVVLAVDEGKLRDGGLLADWRAIRDTFKPNSVPVWVCDSALEYAASWLERHKGLCWVEHRAFGQRLSELTGVPYFGRQGLDVRGVQVDQHRGPAIASAASCSTGFNLQHLHSQNLIMSCEPTGKLWEQLLGRTHRHGQPEDTVTADAYLDWAEQTEGFAQARRDAAYAQPKIGPQKLCYATVVESEWGTGAAWDK